MWTGNDLLGLERNTAPYTPAGDWYDIRGHVVGLYWLARNVNRRNPEMPGAPVRVLEIGIREGVSTLAFLHAARETRGEVFSIECDPDSAEVTKKVINSQGLDAWWTLVLGRSEEVSEKIPGDFDVVMIDGDHGREQVTLDTQVYSPRVRIGGFCLFHDYYSDVRCELPPISGNGPSYASVAAEELRASGKWEVLICPWSYGLAICRRLR